VNAQPNLGGHNRHNHQRRYDRRLGSFRVIHP